MSPTIFTIRVYGLLMHENRVLLSREKIQGKWYTKFPGGGLEPGEGVVDCLKREFQEELGIGLSETELFYVNEDYLASVFHESVQVIVIYYLVQSKEVLKMAPNPLDEGIPATGAEGHVFYWCKLQKLQGQPISLPVDKIVVSRLLKKQNT